MADFLHIFGRFFIILGNFWNFFAFLVFEMSSNKSGARRMERVPFFVVPNALNAQESIEERERGDKIPNSEPQNLPPHRLLRPQQISVYQVLKYCFILSFRKPLIAILTLSS